MNVVHYLPRIVLAEGGVVRAVLDVCEVGAARGHGITLITHDVSDAPAAWRRGERSSEEEYVRMRVCDPPRLPLGFFSKSQLAALDDVVAAADVVHLHTPWERANVQLAHLATRHGKPYVLTVHGMLDDWCMAQRGLKKRVYLSLAGRRLLDGAAAVHCTAEAERAQASKWFDASRAVVIPLIFDLGPFRTLPGPGPARASFGIAESTEPVVLFLGRLHPKKGVEVLIDAIAALVAEGVSVTALIAGTGEAEYEARLRERVRSRGMEVERRVRFLGLVKGVEKVSLLELADVFVLPTSQENFGLVIPEALACRTPVVTTRGVDIWPTIQGAGCAVVVDPVSPRTIADAVKGLLADPSRLRAMGEAGREWVFTALDSGRIMEQYEAMYGAAVGSRAS